MYIKSLFKICLSVVVLTIVIGMFHANHMRNDIRKQLWGLNQLHFFEFKGKLKSRTLPKIDKRVAFKSKDDFGPEPKASITGGLFNHPLTVTLSNEDKDISIFYTLDGSIPTKHSLHYHNPIYIKETTVLRFRSFKPGHLFGDTITHTYFINTDIKLPILSLVSDPVNLWNKYSGIYANPFKRGKKWERNAHVEFYDAKNGLFLRFPAEIRIHGQHSRRYGKKSFRIRYPLSSLPPMDIDNILAAGKQEFERTIIVRNTTRFRLRDVLFHTLYSQVDGFTSRFTPVMLFINGKIWGIYNIRERIDEQYLRKNICPGEYKLIKTLELWKPEAKAFQGVVDWFKSSDLSQKEKLKDAANLIDIDNITDYWLFNIYAANVDWPHSNVAAFKSLDLQSSRWRFIAWDADDSFGRFVGYDHDTLTWAIRNELRHDLLCGMKSDREIFLPATLIMRKLLVNELYRWKFINRFCDLLNFHLLPEKVKAKLNEIIELTTYDLPKDMERWSISKEEYLKDVQSIRNFVDNRSKYLFSFFRKKFRLGALLTVELFNQSIGGEIHINTIKPEIYPWKGQYFEKATIRLTAVPSENYRFVQWTEPSLGKSPMIEFELNRNLKVGAIYERME